MVVFLNIDLVPNPLAVRIRWQNKKGSVSRKINPAFLVEVQVKPLVLQQPIRGILKNGFKLADDAFKAGIKLFGSPGGCVNHFYIR